MFPILEFAFAGKVWIMDLLREGVVYWVVKGYWCTWYHSLLIASYIIPPRRWPHLPERGETYYET